MDDISDERDENPRFCTLRHEDRTSFQFCKKETCECRKLKQFVRAMTNKRISFAILIRIKFPSPLAYSVLASRRERF